MPSERQNIEVQAPPAQSTIDVLITPCSVTADDTLPPLASIPRTAQDDNTVAPDRTAALAIAGVAFCGSALPSVAVYNAPFQFPLPPGT